MNDDTNRQLRKLTGYPDIISAENIAWARNRARLKDDLRLEVIDWRYILDSHEAMRAELSTLQAALEQARQERDAVRVDFRALQDSIIRQIGECNAQSLRAEKAEAALAQVQVQGERDVPCYCCRDGGCQSGCRCHKSTPETEEP